MADVSAYVNPTRAAVHMEGSLVPKQSKLFHPAHTVAFMHGRVCSCGESDE